MLTTLYERIRDSLFLVPAAFITALALLAWLTVTIDAGMEERVPWLLATTVDSTRSTLATIATATITVAAIVVSMTAVVVQLATSQFSPRVTQGFLRDRYQQVTIGVTVGTFVYSLIVLSQVRGLEDATTVSHDVSTTMAVVLAVASMLMIVSFLDQIVRSLRIDSIVRRLAGATKAALEEMPELDPLPIESLTVPDGRDGFCVAMSQHGWVRKIDLDRILEALDGDTIVRLNLRVGDFVADGHTGAEVWPEIDREAVRELTSAIKIGHTRTLESDPAYGIRQLVDIALRALSPSLNDPTTAADIVHQLSGPLQTLLLRRLPGPVVGDDRGNRIYMTRALTHADYVQSAFREIRINAHDQPHVLEALLERTRSLIAVVEDAGLGSVGDCLRTEAEATIAVIRRSSMPAHDKDNLLAFARRVGLLDDGASRSETVSS